MAFCEYSSEVVSQNSTMVDNVFFAEFMPNANGDYVKVYLYGLYKCASGKDNSIESFAKDLQMSTDDVISIFYYWQELGLVQVINAESVLVRYLPIRNAIQKIKKYNVDKYTAFNISAQELIGSKMLTPRELEEFYYLIENLKMEKEAVLKIIEYCVKLKGKNTSVSYIVAVAKNWCYDGVKSSADVDERLEEQERVSGDVVLVLKAMGIKRQATVEEYQTYIGWVKDREIPLDLIVHIAKAVKAKNFKNLDDMIAKVYSLKLYSEKEIDDYIAMSESMYKIAKNVVKSLGLWYDDLTNVVDTYIANWLQLGFDEKAILKLSNYAFKSSVRTLEGLDNSINNMYKLGLLTSESIDKHIDDIVKNDSVIVNILNSLGIDRVVVSSDRMYYKTWVYDWGMTEDIIAYGAEVSRGKYMPMQYLNRLLSDYFKSGVKTIEDAKKHKTSDAVLGSKMTVKKSSKSAKKHNYSKKELDSLFDDISEIEI